MLKALTVYLNLFGLTLELISGFVLTIDAIGIEKVRRWINHLVLMRRYITFTNENESEEEGPYWLIRAGIGFATTGIALITPSEVFDSWAGLIIVPLPFYIALICLIVSNILAWAVKRAQSKTAQVAGFILLAVGIGIQYISAILSLCGKCGVDNRP